jgi:hypothetical protein
MWCRVNHSTLLKIKFSIKSAKVSVSALLKNKIQHSALLKNKIQHSALLKNIIQRFYFICLLKRK